ncbi:MAG: GNAT family N-acetyltransferase [Brooklawnia sp.]
MAKGLAELEWPRYTRRLLLRPAQPSDARAIYECRRIPEVRRWLGQPVEGWAEYIMNYRTRQGRWIVVELDGRLVGGTLIEVQDGWAQAEVADQARGVQAELGWLFHPDVWGQGIATETVHELLAICFDGLGLRRVHAGCFLENIASWKVMEKVGMRREAHYVRESLSRDGVWRDGLEYAMLAEEWAGR